MVKKPAAENITDNRIEQAEITVLRFPENVRRRKEMYLIDPNHCIYEIIDNAVDEFNAGYASAMDVRIERVGTSSFERVTIWDNGRGIPTAPSRDPEHVGETQAEVALGNLTAGGKFDAASGYKTVTSGLHGVGASCVNATSQSFEAVIYHEGTRTTLNYEFGILKTKAIHEPISDKYKHGTRISFILDNQLWQGESFALDIIHHRLQQLTFLNPGLKITYTANDKTEELYHPAGLDDYYTALAGTKELLEAKPVRLTRRVDDPEVGAIDLDFVFGYSKAYSTEVYGFVNGVATTGGDHYVGFNNAVKTAVTSFFNDNDKYKKLAKELTTEDTREGLVAIFSVKVMYPKFEGQSKLSIKMPQVRSAVYNVVLEGFKSYLEQYPTFVKALAEKLEKAFKSRQAAKRARDAARGVKNALVDSSLPGKLAACSSKKPEECSLYIVEGDSAAGSAIQGRDSKTQAILPVFGKVLNTEKSRPEEAVNNSKLLDVVKAMRCGIGKDFNLSKLRYHKIIIMADSDVDGYHISCLWITFFYRFMPEIITNGHLYIALSPLYRVTEYVGKKEVNHYFFDDEELAAFKTKNRTHIAYIKGLGELQPKQLWESTMDPEHRRLIRVTVSEAEMASRAIEKCMGSDVDVRRQFILNNADFEKALG